MLNISQNSPPVQASSSETTLRNKTPLLGLDRVELIDFAASIGQKPFRGKQLYHWLYAGRETDFQQMSDLPADLREKLDQVATAEPLRVVKEQSGFDGSVKLLLEAEDGQRVESVLIPEGERMTVCLSSQVGCAVGCKFCATGLMGFKRNLSAGEIIGQLYAIERSCGKRMTNVVMMGMGEPLLNRPALFKALPILADPDGIGFSRRHITVSTAGWLPGIKALTRAAMQGRYRDYTIDELRRAGAGEKIAVGKPAKDSTPFPRVKLALSLNSTTDEERLELMPLAGRYPLKETLQAAAEYSQVSGERVSVNYLLLAGKNDSTDDARRLANLTRGELFKVNIMEYNDVGSGYIRSASSRVDQFVGLLSGAGVTVTVRTSRGREIGAACGQLATENPK